MKATRRQFLQLSASAALGLFAKCRSQPSAALADLDIEVVNDLQHAHYLFQPPPLRKVGPELTKDVLIVGGGLAGLSAAYALVDRDILLCEVGEGIGGSAGSGSYRGLSFSQGAHYDLAYPSSYGTEVLGLLQRLGILEFNAVRDLWEFKDRHFLIANGQETRSMIHGRYGSDVLPDSRETTQFENLLADYDQCMPQPTRLIRPEFRFLNALSFTEFLKQEGLPLSAAFLEGLDYHMRDDYGASASQVSALAGVHYYRCRPYYSQDLRPFSPPQGNAYFAQKLARYLDPEMVRTSSLVTSIEKKGRVFYVDVLNTQSLQTQTVRADSVVYAGHKHALPYTYPLDAPLFKANRYAPWLVFNFILQDSESPSHWWQNEMVAKDQPNFLGFIDSYAQARQPLDDRVLTAYFCVPEDQRALLLDFETRKREWVGIALELISKVLELPRPRIRKVFIKLYGHAMPIPQPGYLFRDANEKRAEEGLVYAGVDNGRLPLLFEALDSGLLAASLLKR